MGGAGGCGGGGGGGEGRGGCFLEEAEVGAVAGLEVTTPLPMNLVNARSGGCSDSGRPLKGEGPLWRGRGSPSLLPCHLHDPRYS